MPEKLRQATQYLRATITMHKYLVQIVWFRQLQRLFGDAPALMLEQVCSMIA
ncbi:MAG: hypothetical protein R2824_32905 [Saprospiraceae bacterium]